MSDVNCKLHIATICIWAQCYSKGMVNLSVHSILYFQLACYDLNKIIRQTKTKNLIVGHSAFVKHMALTDLELIFKIYCKVFEIFCCNIVPNKYHNKGTALLFNK